MPETTEQVRRRGRPPRRPAEDPDMGQEPLEAAAQSYFRREEERTKYLQRAKASQHVVGFECVPHSSPNKVRKGWSKLRVLVKDEVRGNIYSRHLSNKWNFKEAMALAALPPEQAELKAKELGIKP